MPLAPLRLEESAKTAALSVTHAPIGKGGTNWITRSKPGNTGQLPAYIQNVRNAIMRGGKSESEAHGIAIGRIEDWAQGKGGVSDEVKAASAKAIAELHAMGAKAKAKTAVRESYIGPQIDRIVQEVALTRLAVFERQFGVDGMIGLLAEGMLAEAAASTWTPTLKRTASASSELERHEVHDGSGQQVGAVSRRKSYDRNQPDKYVAHAVNGERVTDYSGGSKADALEALRKHLEEAPARVGKHSSGKWLVARPASYSGPDTFAGYPTESSARFAAGLPEKPSQPEQGSQVQALGEMLRFDLLSVSGLDVPPLRRVQEARRADPFDLVAESFAAGELRDFHGRWSGGGGHHLSRLTPSAVRPGPRAARAMSDAHVRYEGGVPRASAKLRAAHAAKPQIAKAALAGSVGKGAWTAGAAKAARDIMGGRVVDTEHAHRVAGAGGKLGAYSPARQALHQQIIENMLQGKGTHEGSARAIFTAGGPASGKSGLVKTGDSHFERMIGKESTVKLPADVVHADPDIIRTMLPEYKQMIDAGRKDASNATHEEASHLAKVLTKVALGRQHHLLVDTVGDSGPGKFAGKIRQAQAAGHKVSVHYATTDIKTALERANERGKKSGRFVPESYLKEAHAAVSQRFGEVSKIPGIHLQVVDTTARPNSVIAERSPAADKLVIRNGELFRKFLEKGKG